MAETANRVGDVKIVEYIDQQLDSRLQEDTSEPPWRNSVRDEITRSLSGGLPKKAVVARNLGVSERTLQRRLSDDGLTFQYLVEDTQRGLAKQLLKRTDYSLAEIAFLTGFSDQTTFSRAFKRWAGQTPRSYRIG